MYRGKLRSAPAIAANALLVVDHFQLRALAILLTSYSAADVSGHCSRSAGIALMFCSHLM